MGLLWNCDGTRIGLWWNRDETFSSWISDASLSMVTISSNDLPNIGISSQLTVHSLFIMFVILDFPPVRVSKCFCSGSLFFFNDNLNG